MTPADMFGLGFIAGISAMYLVVLLVDLIIEAIDAKKEENGEKGI